MATNKHGITYRSEGFKPKTENHANGDLQYYVDASWADVKPTYVEGKDGILRTIAQDDGRRSSYGYVGYFAGGPVTWSARMHKGRRALSSTESELVAATEAGKDLVHIRQLAKGMHINTDKPTPLYEDNQSTIKQCLSKGISARSKHIEVRWFYVRDLHDDKELVITKIHTSEQPADIYTKVLGAGVYAYLRDKLVEIHTT